MAAYYNEFDPQKAAWLRELIKAGAIADGEVDERSISDVTPGDVVRFTQCHWFAGIGVWSHALRLAGIPDDQPVWTFSCPCQPFSAAGKKAGFADRRHLWPDMFRLIRGGRPVLCFGEQVSSPDGLTWLDAVCADMESEAYTLGAVDLCAAGAGSPHIRNRTFFVAYANEERIRAGRSGSAGETPGRVQGAYGERERIRVDAGECGATGGMADASEFGRIGRRAGETRRESGAVERPERLRDAGRLGDTAGAGSLPGALSGVHSREEIAGPRDAEPQRSGGNGLMGNPNEERSQGRIIGRNGTNECAAGPAGVVSGGAAGPCNGFWSDARWIYCRDDAWRPAQPATLGMADELAGDLGYLRLPGNGSDEGREVFFPLIQKGKARTQRLRGYGDGIVAELAAEFIRCCIEERDLRKPSALRGK